MNENFQTPEQKQENEIDLLTLTEKFFRSLGRGIKTFFKWIGIFTVWLTKFILRHFGLLATFVIIGLSIALTFYFTRPLNYKGEAMLQCNGFNAQILELDVNKLNTMIKQNEFLYVARTLGISDDLAKQISNVRMGYGIDLDEDGIPNEVSYDEEGKKNIIEETVLKGTKDEPGVLRKKIIRGRIPGLVFLSLETSTKNATNFRLIGNAIFNYIKKSASISVLYESSLLDLRSEIGQLDFQIARLDSLQNIEYIEMNRKRNDNSNNSEKIVFSSNQEKGRQLFHTEILELSKQKNALEAKLRLQGESITVLSNFQPIIDRPNLFKMLSNVYMISAIIGLIVAFCIENRKSIKEFIRKSRAEKS